MTNQGTDEQVPATPNPSPIPQPTEAVISFSELETTVFHDTESIIKALVPIPQHVEPPSPQQQQADPTPPPVPPETSEQ